MQRLQLAAGECVDEGFLGTQADGVGLLHDGGQCGKLFKLYGGRKVDAPTEVGQQFANARRNQWRGQRVAEQVVGGEAVLGQQRVPGAAEKHAAPRRQGLGLEVRVSLKVTHVGDKELDLFTVQAAPEFLPVIHLQGSAHLGIGGDKACHRLGHQVHGGHGVAAQAHFARIEFGHARDFMAQQRRALHQAQCVLQHHLAFGGGTQVFVRAVHQHAAELLFQALDAAAERRLRDAHGIRRAHETAVLVERDEVAQLAKVHGMPGILWGNRDFKGVAYSVN
ncbi:hypothetical protein AYR47_08130 [Pseudomonas azotoformans]|uniref:Uncharacterized protein n=1 Tax=Pseudomonas azotoformans TaxID=47878 RepID=A0A127HUJ3_PSEAZ|nr:hypothetical protein AYR47_08130 [Pseudomonas azotoformans]